MPVPLRVLLLEDRPADAELILEELRRAGFEPVGPRVDTEAEYLGHLSPALDVILADYALPQFDAGRALALLQERGLDVPFLVVSATIGEEVAVAMMRQGAADYLLKDRLARLGQAVAAAIERRRAEQVRRALATVGYELSTMLDVDQATDKIVSTVLGLLRVPRAGLCRLDSASGALTCVAAAGEGDPAALVGGTLPPGVGVTGRAIAEGRATWSPDVLEDPELPAWLRQDIERHPYRAAAAAPLVARGERLGALVVADRLGRVFTEGDVEVLSVFADRAALALENASLYRRATERAEKLQQAYADLARTQAELTQAQKMESVGRLAGGIAHDFNNLLTVIIGRSQILFDRLPAGHPERRNIDVVRATADRAARLVRQLLAFSRKQVLQPRLMDLNAVVGPLGPLLRRLIGEDIEVTVIQGERVRPIRADLAQLEQVIMNLAVNARDAMPAGGRLTIETANVDVDESEARRLLAARGGPHVTLTVTDTGVGMDPEVQARLFEPFFTTKEPGKGTGLGLATVYGIVKQHEGFITIESEPGRGSRFTISLPAVEGEVEVAGAEAAFAPVPQGSETILLVEDEDEVRALAREICRLHGYHVLEASGPEEALRVWEREGARIQLLVTDVVMPGMSGRELAGRLTAERRDLKVLYISGYTADVLGAHGVLEPGIALVEKPFTPHTFCGKVRELLDQGAA